MAGTLDIGALETRLQGIEGVMNTIRTWVDSTATPGLEKAEQGITGLLDRIVGVELIADNQLVPFVTATKDDMVQMQSRIDGVINRIDTEANNRQAQVQDNLSQVDDKITAMLVNMMESARTETANWKTASAQMEQRFNVVGATMQELAAVITNKIQEFDKNLEQIKGMSKGSGTGHQEQHHSYRGKDITEYKIIDKLKVLDSDRKEYRSWQEDLKNALDRVDSDLRKTMDKIEITEWGKGERMEWESKEGTIRDSMIIDLGDWTKQKHDLYSVLINKTAGDARMLVRNEEKDGLMGYMRLHKWFTESSGRGMSERIRRVLKPEKAKKESEIFERVEKWEEELREVEKIKGRTIMDEDLKKVALKDICCGAVVNELDIKEQQWTYEQMRQEVMRWAFKRRTESKKAPMNGPPKATVIVSKYVFQDLWIGSWSR